MKDGAQAAESGPGSGGTANASGARAPKAGPSTRRGGMRRSVGGWRVRNAGKKSCLSCSGMSRRLETTARNFCSQPEAGGVPSLDHNALYAKTVYGGDYRKAYDFWSGFLVVIPPQYALPSAPSEA